MYTVVMVKELFKNFKELEFSTDIENKDIDVYGDKVWIPSPNNILISKIGTVKKLTSKLYISDKVLDWDGIKGFYMFTSEDVGKDVRDTLKREYNISVVYLETVKSGIYIISGIDYNDRSKFLFEEIRTLLGID